jgi:hypothetical protein
VARKNQVAEFDICGKIDSAASKPNYGHVIGFSFFFSELLLSSSLAALAAGVDLMNQFRP